MAAVAAAAASPAAAAAAAERAELASLHRGCGEDLSRPARRRRHAGLPRSKFTAVSAACKAEIDANPLESGDTPSCYRSPICGNRLTGAVGGGKGKFSWKHTLTYTPSQPFKDLIKGTGGMVSVGIDSKDNIWGLQRNPAGQPQLFKFSPDGKLLLTSATT